MIRRNCCSEVNCEAPLCPMENSLTWKDYSPWWCRNQPICRNVLFSELVVIKNQKNILDKTENNDYYCPAMLDFHFKINKKTVGVKNLEEVKQWLRDNPAETLKSKAELLAEKELPTMIQMTKDRALKVALHRLIKNPEARNV